MVDQVAAKGNFELAMLVQNAKSNKFPAACRYKATGIFGCYVIVVPHDDLFCRYAAKKAQRDEKVLYFSWAN